MFRGGATARMLNFCLTSTLDFTKRAITREEKCQIASLPGFHFGKLAMRLLGGAMKSARARFGPLLFRWTGCLQLPTPIARPTPEPIPDPHTLRSAAWWTSGQVLSIGGTGPHRLHLKPGEVRGACWHYRFDSLQRILRSREIPNAQRRPTKRPTG